MGYKKRKLRADLRELFEARNLTIPEIADRLSVSPGAVINWFDCKCQPNKVYIPAIAAMLALTEDELFEGR